MLKTVQPGMRTGSVTIPASKSQAHRMLICAALSESPCTVHCDGISKDIEATVACLNGLGASIAIAADGMIRVKPVTHAAGRQAVLPCNESGSTLRFMLPIVGALGADATMTMAGRLPERPLAPLDDVLKAHGMTLIKDNDKLLCGGKLISGAYEIPGNISSQYISGLLFALPLLEGDSTLTVTGTVESQDYIAMTEDALRMSGIRFDKQDNVYRIPGSQVYRQKPDVIVEKDWSNAAFLLCLGALSENGITAKGLSTASSQGDKRILDIIRTFGAVITETPEGIHVRHARLTGYTIDASQIPDLVPVICTLAAGAAGTTRITHAERLRIKESDRIKSTCDMLRALGADIRETEDGMIISGGSSLCGGTIDSCNDHRIAMSAAVASSLCTAPVEVIDAQCIAKSYPRFWDDLESLEVQ